jgi:hypothetical protein
MRVRQIAGKNIFDGRFIKVRRSDKNCRKIERLYKFRGYKKL